MLHFCAVCSFVCLLSRELSYEIKPCNANAWLYSISKENKEYKLFKCIGHSLYVDLMLTSTIKRPNVLQKPIITYN